VTSSKTPWPIVALLCATATAGYMCRVNVSTAGALLMKDFQLTQVEMGRIFSAFLLGYALFQIPGGMLADRWGARRVLSIATWLWVGLTALQALVGWHSLQMSVTSSLVVFLFLRFLLGISAAPTYPAAGQGVSRWVIPYHQGRANGIIISSIGLGSALTPPLVSYVMIHWDWRLALIVSAIPALLLAILWQRIPERDGTVQIPPEVRTDQPAHTNGLRSKSFVLLTISYALQGYVGYIFVSWFYLYLVDERHFSLLTGAWVSSLPWVLSIVSIPFGGWLSDRLAAGRIGPAWGRRIVPMVGLSFSGILISIGAHTPSPWIAAIALAFATAFVLCVEGPFWAMMMRISKTQSGTAGGIMNMGSNLGGLISPVLTPLLAVYVGWENALHLAAGLAIIAGLTWLGIHSQEGI
jgi:ACS family glucarate transporter-like MFS transporter